MTEETDTQEDTSAETTPQETTPTRPEESQSQTKSKSKKEQVKTGMKTGGRLALLLGFVGFFLGAWLLLDASGVDLPPLARWWPIFVALGGLASLLDYLLLSHKPRSAGQAVFGFGLAAYFFLFSFGHVDGFDEFLDWLPTLPTIIAAAVLTTWWVAGRRSRNLLVIGTVLLGLGGTGFLLRFEKLREILPTAQILWAVLLLLAGGYLVWRTFRPE